MNRPVKVYKWPESNTMLKDNLEKVQKERYPRYHCNCIWATSPKTT